MVLPIHIGDRLLSQAQELNSRLRERAATNVAKGVGTRIFLLLHRAHKYGNIDATLDLARFYFEGVWVMKNPKEAKKYLDMCVQMGGTVPEEISLQVQSAILSEEHPKLPPKLYIVGNLHNPK